MTPEQPASRHPQIRMHRYEQAFAVKWPGDDRWLIVWGDGDATAEWRDNPNDSLGFDKLAPDDEWMDPIAEHRKPVTPWTDAIRKDVASIQRILDSLDNHPWG